ncbi:hypothetical protein QQF64_015654 [Cirrhinus molitorella]|uniref:Secreted protein n=1 Tax=Cirrhinus molitorella TaxID=172907 RepID=A0ABR3NVI5_9TELE
MNMLCINSMSVCKKSEVHQLALHISLLCLQPCPSFAFICTDDTGTLQRFCRVHSPHAGRLELAFSYGARASEGCLHERGREKKGKAAETETGV